MKGNVTVKTLAKELNISIATVSKALNDSYEISIDTKQKVWDLAKKLKYERNPAASNLRSHKTKTIAVIIPEIANNFFSLAINGIEEIARKRDYHVLIYQTHENSETEIAFTDSLLSGRVDGILISVSSSTENYEHFKELVKKIPVVFFDRTIEDIDAVKITTDDYESSYNAACHLIENGCKNIAYLYALNNLSTGQKRLSGYQDALRDHNLPANPDLIISYDKDAEKNYDNIKQLIVSQKPDGIISSIEEFALPCYYVCRDLGLNIPDDLKIISFSNLSTAPLLSPSLSTITQPAFEIGKEAAGFLFKILDKKPFDQDEVPTLKSTLIKRESSS
ncbi:MAG TPA: LacI family DNA-binding transcriptional regulator [Pedobacter sp.]|uniref:LacI family DNA-binding transcriptional regulator n=1 Tax=Pedobacter sp. TaxID=1411316 RepID=UPI002D1BB09A|nr:LacI family DNA-binding transcriptional regulator [Pedobacter sp.]HMI05689.1 LacI family DNA-binding transcriptional regulator [Pedobacter sp.]